MYVAVKGGERAIENAHALLAAARRGDLSVPELGVDQISEQLALAVDRVMGEGSLYDRELAALAIKQARGDLIEAIFLVRAYRTTLPRFGTAAPIDTAAMDIRRRISATFKDLPGGQVLGPTFDYTHRLLDHELAAPAPEVTSPHPACASGPGGGDSASTNSASSLAPPSPHPGLPSAAENRSLPSPCRGGCTPAVPSVFSASSNAPEVYGASRTS
jgi:alpha-D-ribose 1-methylphosphonate 5-triphosphate synthase subunit PhnI